MLSFVARVLGLLLFAVGLVSLISDGISTIAADELVMTPLSVSLSLITPDVVDQIGGTAQRLLGAAVWEEWGPAVLSWPTFAVTGIVGIFLMLAGARRPRQPKTHAHFVA